MKVLIEISGSPAWDNPPLCIPSPMASNNGSSTCLQIKLFEQSLKVKSKFSAESDNGLTLAGGAFRWLSSCDTAKTSDSLVLSHRSKFKQEKASLSLWPQGKILSKDKMLEAHRP